MKHRISNRILALLLTLTLVISLAPAAFAAEDSLTRGEARDMLLVAADDYQSGLTAGDILHGYPDGDLRENQTVTRVEALVMLSRAFGELPEPVGDNARWGAAQFTDVPAWAQEELADVFASGIVQGTDDALFSPNEPVTEEQMELFIRRTYALMASNPRDDFYAAVNKEWLDSSIIQPGYSMNGTIYEIEYNTNQQVKELIEEIAAGTHADGSPEDKIQTLYQNILNWDARNAAGIDPIRPYLDAIEAASTLDELMEAHNQITVDTSASMLLGYGVTQDLADTDKKVLAFATMSPTLPKEYYAEEVVVEMFAQYIATILMLGGEESAETAMADARAYIEVEKVLSDASLSQVDQTDINKTYNLYPAEDIKALFPHVDLDAIREADRLPAADTYVVSDPGLLEAAAGFFTEENLDQLKLAARIALLSNFGAMLNREFKDAAFAFNSVLTGVTEQASDEESAASAVQSYLSDYLGQVYVEEYFSPEAKAGVEEMIDDMLAVYEDRIEALDWMSETTKTKAIEKLNAITVKVGYPDEWDDMLDDVDLRSVAEGGSYYENVIAMNKAAWAELVAELDQPVDKDAWAMPAYMVNAYYDATANSINFPAGILQAPLYDEDADYTENLGGIGYIIAHEITHAFDDTGAQFDAEGNQNNWWTEEDYAAFQALCAEVAAFYDGVEAIPGVACNGELTIGENVADLGALACITQIESQQEQPDYKTLYESVARSWRSASSREMRTYLATLDTHAPDKLRGNRALQSLDEFYEAFDIQPGDGMYLAPEERVRVW